MRKSLLGWIVFAVCVAGGYTLGRHRKALREERVRVEAERRRQAEAERERRTAELEAAAAEVSTDTLPADLPSDFRRPESVPRELE